MEWSRAPSVHNIGGYHGCVGGLGRGLLSGMTTASSTYALRLSDDELGRFRMMAVRARAEEGDLWTQAGIVPGARVADVGCGPGAMLVTAAFAALDATTDRPDVGLGVFAAVCRRPV